MVDFVRNLVRVLIIHELHVRPRNFTLALQFFTNASRDEADVIDSMR